MLTRDARLQRKTNPSVSSGGNSLQGPSTRARPRLRLGREVSLWFGVHRASSGEEHEHPQCQFTIYGDASRGVLARREADGYVYEQHLVGPGIFCVAPLTRHAERWHSASRLAEVYFEPSFLARLPVLDVRAALSRENAETVMQDLVVWTMVSTLERLWHERPLPPTALMEVVALAFGRKFFTRHGANTPILGRTRLSAAQLQRVLNFIREHLDQALRVAQLAKAADIAGYRFGAIFRNTTGLPPMTYVREMRLAMAHEMAFSGEDRIGKIASQCGFRDEECLDRNFRQLFGYSLRLLRDRRAPGRPSAAGTRLRRSFGADAKP